MRFTVDGYNLDHLATYRDSIKNFHSTCYSSADVSIYGSMPDTLCRDEPIHLIDTFFYVVLGEGFFLTPFGYC